MIYSFNDAYMTLGCLMNNTDLLLTKKFPINKDDFVPCTFHMILFSAILHLASEGAMEIDEIMVDNFCKHYKPQYEVLEDNNFLEFISTVKELANANNYEIYYNNVRKLSLLRQYKEMGVDISEIYEENEKGEINFGKLNQYSIKDILNFYESKYNQLRTKFDNRNVRAEMWAGEGFTKVLEEFQKEPSFGACLNSPYLTSIYRGWQRGHLLMRSAPSGFGKTSAAIGDLCKVSVTHLWDKDKKDFVKNHNYQGNGFYIHTEMEQERELQPRFIAYIADIPTHKILDGKFTEEEKDRLIEAGKILRKSNIRLIDMPDFTLTNLRRVIKECAIIHHCKFGVFDYIWDNGIVGKDYKERIGTSLRQDMLLLAIANELKMCAEDYSLGLLSMTQLNGNEKNNDVIDENCLFGSKQLKTKLDNGCIVLKPKKSELSLMQTIINRKRLEEKTEPNIITHVYKARYSQYGQNIKVWQSFDFNTGRVKDLFCTDEKNNYLNSIPKTFIKEEE